MYRQRRMGNKILLWILHAIIIQYGWMEGSLKCLWMETGLCFSPSILGSSRWLTCKETLNPYGVKDLTHIQENHACESLLMKVPVHCFDELHHCSAMLYLCQNLNCFVGSNQHSVSLPRIPVIRTFSNSLPTMSSRLNGMTGTRQQGILSWLQCG